ncbi:MAG: hypothetical protein JKY95_06525 [Planctomycetaceae bacterium]|nr:hypothetical protein [Planctomycetaceae bacterium]
MEIVIIMIIGSLGMSLFIGLVIFFSLKYEKARTAQFQDVADELGLQFDPDGNSAVQGSIGQLQLFNQGHSKSTKNMLSGQNQDVDIAIFGYQYTTGTGKNSNTYSQSVISFQSSNLSLPKFELRPERIFHKIGQMFGYQDIDFDSHPGFSKQYILRAPDEAAVREFFTEDILDFFESQKGISIEASDNQLIYYRASKRIKPEDVKDFMSEGFNLYALLKQE